MDEDFISLRAWLVAAAPASPEEPNAHADVAEDEPSHHALDDSEEFEPDDLADVLGEIRRFRAALTDALELKTQELMGELACEVIGRELAAGIDISAIVARAVERYGTPPLRLRVNANDARAARTTGYETVLDESLRSGDVVLELTCGSIDARLGTRLERVLAEAR